MDLHFPDSVSTLARDFISRLLQYSPEERMSLTDALTHPWIQEGDVAPAATTPAPTSTASMLTSTDA